MLFGLAVLALVYAVARRLQSSAAGLWAVSIGAVSFPFSFSSHLARQDTILLTIAMGMITLAVYDDGKGPPYKAALAGLLVGAGLDVHPNIIIYVPVVLALYLVDYGLRILKSSQLWAFVAGAGLGVALYLAIHALPNLSTFKEIAYMQNGSGHNPPIISPELWYWAVYGTFWLVGTAAWLVVLVSLLDRLLDKSWSAGFVKMQVIFSALVASFTAVILNRPAHYIILLAAPVWLIAGGLADRLFRRSWVGSLPVMVRSVAMAAVLLLPDGDRRTVFDDRSRGPLTDGF